MGKIKTIDVTAKEWFDRKNGNHYFSTHVIIDYGMKSEKKLNIPLQDGYGDQYIFEARDLLIDQGCINPELGSGLFRYCEENKIIIRTVKHENCKKRDVRSYGIKVTAKKGD